MHETPASTRYRAAAKITEAKAIADKATIDKREITADEELKILGLLGLARELQCEAAKREGIRSTMPTWKTLAEAEEFLSHSERLTDAGGAISGWRGASPLDGDAPQRSGAIFQDESGKRVHALAPTDRLSQGHLPVGIGEVIQSMLTGRAELASPEFQAAIGGVDPSGGYLLSSEASQIFVDLARSASVCLRAGAATVPMNSAEMTLVRLSQDPTPVWRPEGVDVQATDLLFERVTLRPKTLAAIIPVTIELLEDGANVQRIIEGALTAAMGQLLDKVALVGTGASSEPLGIRNHSGVNTVGTVGTPTDYSKYSSAVQKIFEANFAGEPGALAWIAHPRDLAKLDVLEDTTGQPLNATPWTSALRKFSTTSLPTTEGGGSNESIGIIGDFSQLIFGMRTSGVVIRVLESGTVTDSAGVSYNAAASLRKLVVAYLRADTALLRPKHFTVLSGITVT